MTEQPPPPGSHPSRPHGSTPSGSTFPIPFQRGIDRKVRYRGPDPSLGYAYVHSHVCPLEEVPAITHISETICDPNYTRDPHSHAVIEICYVLAGRGTRRINDEEFTLVPGDVIIMRPGEVHAARAEAGDRFHFFVVGFDPQWISPQAIDQQRVTGSADLCFAFAETTAVDAQQNVLNQRIISNAFGAEHIFRRILQELDAISNHPKARALSIMMIQLMIVELLVFITRCTIPLDEQSIIPAHRRSTLRKDFQVLLHWLEETVSAPPTLSQMAERVGLSPAHFTMVFRQQTGLTPIEYVTTLRIDEAIKRMRSSPRIPLARIAHALGFRSSQYFSCVFRKVKGISPRDWRKTME